MQLSDFIPAVPSRYVYRWVCVPYATVVRTYDGKIARFRDIHACLCKFSIVPLLDTHSGTIDMLSVADGARAFAAAHAALRNGASNSCTLDDVPILRMILRPCQPGFAGFRCDVRWDLQDSFLPAPRRWVRQWNASIAKGENCQAVFFAAFAEVLTRVHWEQEWDAQPFRIAATPPRTMGKMLHQLVTANYYHLTFGPFRRPEIRKGPPAPGSYMRALPNPGFRWNILDYGGGMREQVDYKRLVTMPGNVFSRPLSGSRRCASNPGARRAAWHCLWQRFPGQALPSGTPPRGTSLAVEAERLCAFASPRNSPSLLPHSVTARGSC